MINLQVLLQNILKAILFFSILILGTTAAGAQTVYKADANGKLTARETPTAKKPVELTAYTIEKGTGAAKKTYKVYRGSKGGLFINRVSKKSGKSYKQYIKIEGIK